jgi:hypothetical protein
VLRITIGIARAKSIPLIQIRTALKAFQFGSSRAINGVVETGQANMTLRITQKEDQDAVTLKLEGKVAGPWVRELDRTWRSVAASLGTKRLLVDLCGVTNIDIDGNRVLADICKETCAQFVADNPMTKYFADRAQLKNLTNSTEGK